MGSQPPCSILWFRDDLRLWDHPALSAAAEAGPVLCIYILDEDGTTTRPLGGASRWWLHHSLGSLSAEIENRSGRLDLLRGPPEELIPKTAQALRARSVFWTRRYDGAGRRVDGEVSARLVADGVRARVFDGSLLHDPSMLLTHSRRPFRVFTPFWRALRGGLGDIGPPLRAPRSLTVPAWPKGAPARVGLSDLRLLPTRPDWAGGLREAWRPGEPTARRTLSRFIESKLSDYAETRDRPAADATSRLSPHLRFGEISPRQIWRATIHATEESGRPPRDAEKFLSELAWREFSYHLLFHNPELATRNFNPTFDAFPWREPKPEVLEAWRRGRTGFPIVDAGMRELWRTGYMHNRVRLIVASFLVKDLLIDWRMGESWFWDTLCDADQANNAANWQWCAGSGADAAPFFRIFNPVLQSRKFDPDGTYIRTYVPELRDLPHGAIHEPWTSAPGLLALAGVKLGETYPLPIVDHGQARARALAALAATKKP